MSLCIPPHDRCVNAERGEFPPQITRSARVETVSRTVRWHGDFLDAELTINRTPVGGDHDDLRLKLASPTIGAITLAGLSEAGVAVEIIGQCERAELAEAFRALAVQLDALDRVIH